MPAINALKHAKVINPPSMFSINMEIVLRGPLQDQRVRKALNLADGSRGHDQRHPRRPRHRRPSAWSGPGHRTSCGAPSLRSRSTRKGRRSSWPKPATGPGSLSLTLTCPNGRYIKDAQVCQAIAGSFENIGIKATANVVDRGTWSKIIGMDPAGRTDNMGMVGRATAGMDYTLYRLFRTGVGANRTGYSNPARRQAAH